MKLLILLRSESLLINLVVPILVVVKLRLAFAIITQIDPEILLIDEALAVGDAYFQHKCALKIRKFREEGKTLIFVSHSPDSIKSLYDRAILLETGKIRDGKADEVLDYYNAIIAKKRKTKRDPTA